MIRDAISKLVVGQSLSLEEAQGVMSDLMDGRATQAQAGAVLTALRMKGETVDELVGFATVMRERSTRVTAARRPLIDTCGTGGDSLDTFNISTAAAFVVAGAGVAVAKHGGRAVSSKCGSADVLEAMGVQLDLTPEQIGRCIDEVGVGFMFAPRHHPAMRHLVGPRRELGIRTVLNVLGPLTNPAGAPRQLIGVCDPTLCQRLAEALCRLGAERAMVVHGVDGLDEISTIGPTRIVMVQHGRVSAETRVPTEFHVVPTETEAIAGGRSIDANAAMLRAVLAGERGPRRDIVSVNAAAGVMLGGLADNWRDAVAAAHVSIDSGRALGTLEKLIRFSQECIEHECPV